MKNGPKSFRNPSEIEKNRSKNGPKSFRNREKSKKRGVGEKSALKWHPGGSNHSVLYSIVDFFVEKGAPKVDFGTRRKSQMAPNSHFWVQKLQQIHKKSFQEGFQKKHEKMIQK
jgi:hypothetical protein